MIARSYRALFWTHTTGTLSQKERGAVFWEMLNTLCGAIHLGYSRKLGRLSRNLFCPGCACAEVEGDVIKLGTVFRMAE